MKLKITLLINMVTLLIFLITFLKASTRTLLHSLRRHYKPPQVLVVDDAKSDQLSSTVVIIKIGRYEVFFLQLIRASEQLAIVDKKEIERMEVQLLCSSKIE